MAKAASLQTVPKSSVPDYFQDYKSSGVGLPTEASDFLIPMAKVLDAKSPEATKGSASRVQGAEAGDILIKNAPMPLIKGDVGFLFQPCRIDKAVIEWLPRSRGGGGGGGFVARHAAGFLETSDDVGMAPHPETPSKMVSIRKSNGNLLVETRYYGGYAVVGRQPLPLVLPFASTGHTVAKQWNMLAASKHLPDGRPADLWLVYYKVKTRLRTRQDQSWYLFDITDAGPDDPDTGLPTTLWAPSRSDVDRGKILHDQLASGDKKIADEDVVVHDDKAF